MFLFLKFLLMQFTHTSRGSHLRQSTFSLIHTHGGTAARPKTLKTATPALAKLLCIKK